MLSESMQLRRRSSMRQWCNLDHYYSLSFALACRCRGWTLLLTRCETYGSGAFREDFRLLLRTDWPVLDRCWHGTLLHLSLRRSPKLPPRSALYSRSRTRLTCSPPRPPTRCGIGHARASSPRLSGIGPSLQCHPFSGPHDSAGQLLHTP